MTASRLQGMAGIGVDEMGNQADASQDPEILRLENLDTNLPLPPGVITATQTSVADKSSNSYLPFLGSNELREAATDLVTHMSGVAYESQRTIISAGGLNGILNVLLALIEPGDEVILPDPVYIGLINRVRLAGGIPVFIPTRVVDGVWQLERDTIAKCVTNQTKAFLMMSPVMPSGATFSREDWQEICRVCLAADALMIYNAAMERLLFDDCEYIHPCMFEGMTERTITIGAVSKEYRMIGWRIGWIVAPEKYVDDIALVNISNVVCNVGIAQAGAVVALRSNPQDLLDAVATLEARRNLIMQQLTDYPLIKPQGGWSLLIDVGLLGMSAKQASQRLFDYAKIAATPMIGWGGNNKEYVRFVFANESSSRLQNLEQRIQLAWNI